LRYPTLTQENPHDVRPKIAAKASETVSETKEKVLNERSYIKSFKEEFLQDPLYAAIIENSWFQRLGGIAFLGVLAYSENRGVQDTRLDHSLGVGVLAYSFCKLNQLPKPLERLFVSSALLHDIHHLPFSHTMEFALRNEMPDFSLASETEWIIGHAQAGEKSIADRLASFDIDPYSLPLFKKRMEQAAIFGRTHNVDTLEGIARASRVFFSDDQTAQDLPFEVLMVLSGARHSEKPYLECVATLDSFWHMKNKVYSEGIYSFNRILFERLFAYHLFHLCKRENILTHLTHFRDRDFFEMFEGLDQRLQELWELTDSLTFHEKLSAASREVSLVFTTCDNETDVTNSHSILAAVRRFVVNENKQLSFRFGASWTNRYLLEPRNLIIHLSSRTINRIQEILGNPIQSLAPRSRV
jgi:hypothetical protein